MTHRSKLQKEALKNMTGNVYIYPGLKLYPGWLGQEKEKGKGFMPIRIGIIAIVHATANVQNVSAINYGHKYPKIMGHYFLL